MFLFRINFFETDDELLGKDKVPKLLKIFFLKRGGSLEKGCLRKLKRFRVALIRRNRYN